VRGDASVFTAPATGVYMLAAVHYIAMVGLAVIYIERKIELCMLYLFGNGVSVIKINFK
jgi:hypothetical protein